MTIEGNASPHRAGAHAPGLKRIERVPVKHTVRRAFLAGIWCDLASLVVGAFLFSSPWILGFGGPAPNTATQTAGVLGAVIGVTSFAALAAFEVWEEYILLLASAAAILSPLVIGLAGLPAVTVGLSGVMAFALATSRLLLLRRAAAAPC
ncbi:SPW repeat protein [Bradyrhizobium sp. SZCCHNR1015]|uniref:SPW repeat domain-containing protein n=1 Tax=Bradyrhizobium sp. SZCCHNR1015 TaxID=3057338 RepID=UPI002915C4A8|nr:SPW repeat protein [Bradyrhizobium sp. SZCCHNR1015]